MIGNQVEDQQVCYFIVIRNNYFTNYFIYSHKVSCLWQGNYLLTVSLNGFITYLDVNNPDKPIRIIKVIII